MVEPVILIVSAIVAILIIVSGILLIVFGSRKTHPGMTVGGVIVLLFGLGVLAFPLMELISPS